MKALDELSMIYESVLISEMTQKVVDYISHNKDKLPFENIFGDKLRIVIPIGGTDVIGEILHDLRQIKDYSEFDKDTLEVVRKVKLDPKYGQGSEKTQRINLGKAIQGLKIPEKTKKIYLNWYAKYKDSIPEMDIENKYSIILSRAPVDIVRMSDHSNISSCHSVTGSYFKCAIQEAIDGGAIAYLVYRNSLEHVDTNSKEFQEDDIFSDKDRDLRGVAGPLARLKIRNIKNEYNGTEFALPETKIYGINKSPAFYSSVRDFLKTKQSASPEYFRNTSHSIVGGSYEDTEPVRMVNRYFGLDRTDAELDSVDIEVPGDRTDEEDSHNRLGKDLEEELRYIDQDSSLEHIDVHYYVDENDGEEYFTARASMSFDISGMGVSDDLDIDAGYSDELHSAMKCDPNIKSFVEALEDLLVGNVYIVGVLASSTELVLQLSSSSDEEIMYDSSDYESFLNDLEKIDNNWEDNNNNTIEYILVKHGYMSGDSLSEIRKWEDLEEHPYQYFTIEGSEISNYYAKYAKYQIAQMVNTPEDLKLSGHIPLGIIVNASFNQTFANSLRKYVTDTYTPPTPSVDNQMDFESYWESVEHPPSWDSDFDFTVNVSTEFGWYNSKYEILSVHKFHIYPTNFKNPAMYFLEFIDHSYPTVKNLLAYIIIRKIYEYLDYKPDIQKTFISNITNYKQLNLAFSKYYI